MTTLADALAPKSDQLNADDLISGPRVLKITGARVVKDDRRIKIVLNYENDQGKPFKPCKTMARAMVLAWQIKDDQFEQQFIGKSIRVYRDAEVSFGDQRQIGGIRISHMSHIDKPVIMKLTVSQGKKAAHTFNPLLTEAPALDDTAARAWLDKHIAAINAAADVAALDAVTAQAGKALAKMAAQFPALRDQAVQRANDRAAELTDDDPFASGPDDSQRGETHNDTSEDRANDLIGQLDDVPIADLDRFVLAINFAGISRDDEQRVRNRASERKAGG